MCFFRVPFFFHRFFSWHHVCFRNPVALGPDTWYVYCMYILSAAALYVAILLVLAACCRLLPLAGACCRLLPLAAACCRLLLLAAACCRLLLLAAACCYLPLLSVSVLPLAATCRCCPSSYTCHPRCSHTNNNSDRQSLRTNTLVKGPRRS